MTKCAAWLNPQFGRGFQQRSCVGVFGCFSDFLRGAGFDDAAALHDCDASAEVADNGHGVRNEEVGEPEVALKLLEQVDDLGAHADVERRDGFVGHDELGAEGEGAGDADALALSAAEFVGEPAGGGLVHADGAEQFKDAVATGFAAYAFVDDERLGDDIFDPEAGIEGTEGILKNDLHVAAEAAEFGLAGDKQIVTPKVNAAGSGFDKAEDQAAESTFAGAGFADQAESFAGIDGEGDIVDGANFTLGVASEERFSEGVDLGEVADFDEGHGGMVAG